MNIVMDSSTSIHVRGGPSCHHNCKYTSIDIGYYYGKAGCQEGRLLGDKGVVVCLPGKCSHRLHCHRLVLATVLVSYIFILVELYVCVRHISAIYDTMRCTLCSFV
jgi:hypothetical protein